MHLGLHSMEPRKRIPQTILPGSSPSHAASVPIPKRMAIDFKINRVLYHNLFWLLLESRLWRSLLAISLRHFHMVSPFLCYIYSAEYQ